jgi:ribose transport system substrate-binding protein
MAMGACRSFRANTFSLFPWHARILLAAATALALVGCGGTRQEAKYRIAVIPKGTTHEFWQSIERGALRAARDLQEKQGITVEAIWDGPLKENESQAQISIIDRQLAARVSGIVLAPQHSEAMVPPVERAVSQGVPVLVIDSGLSPEGQKLIVKYIATNNYNGGKLAAEYLLKVLREHGKEAPNLVLFRYQVGSESTDQREKGFEDYVNGVIADQKKAGKPTISWVSTNAYAGATQDTAVREATPLLNNLRDRGVDGIFAPNESSASGMLAALRSLQLNKKIHLVGFDSSAPLVDALREGDVDGLILQDPYRMGYLGVWTLVQYLEGYNVTPDGQKVQSTGENVITRENLDAPSTRALFEADMQEQRTIEVPAFPKK